jgi:hypothetical protein
VASQLGWPPRHLLGNQELITQSLLAATVVPVVVGTTMPAWGSRVGLARLLGWVGRYRAHRRLYRLWRALCQAVPNIALEPPVAAWRETLRARHLTFRVQRRCTEIRDAQLALRPWLDPQAAGAAEQLGRQAGLDGEQLQAVVEAATLAVAVQAKLAGRAPPRERGAVAGPGGSDLDSESRWLGRVASAYLHSPVVGAVLSRQRAEQHPMLSRSTGHAR